MDRGRVVPPMFDLDLLITFKYAKMSHWNSVYGLLEMKNMIPAAKERLNLSKAEKWANERMPAMMPAKHAIPERIMNARVAFQYAEDKDKKCSQNNRWKQVSSSHPPNQFLSLFVWFFWFDLGKTVPAESPLTNHRTAPVISDAILLDEGNNFGAPVQNTNVQHKPVYGALHSKKNKPLPSTGKKWSKAQMQVPKFLVSEF